MRPRKHSLSALMPFGIIFCREIVVLPFKYEGEQFLSPNLNNLCPVGCLPASLERRVRKLSQDRQPSSPAQELGSLCCRPQQVVKLLGKHVSKG